MITLLLVYIALCQTLGVIGNWHSKWEARRFAKSADEFNRKQLEAMRAAGIRIIDESPPEGLSGAPFPIARN